MGQFHFNSSVTTIIMKFLVLSACLAVSSAAPSFYGLVAHPNGAIVPADEPAVAAARADHLAAQGVVAHAAYGHAAIAPAAVAAPLNLNTALVAHPNGAVVPADEPAVVAARADHLAAKGAAFHAAVASGPGPVGPIAPAGPAPHALGYAGPAPAGPLGYAGPLAGVPALVAHPNGAVVPADEPAVVAARADLLAAKGAAFHA